MGIGKRIRQARENQSLTQKELADLVGVTGPAIANYENETSHPKEPVMYQLLRVLDVDANFLFQDEMPEDKTVSTLSLKEQNHLSSYRTLDDYGRETVDIVLAREAQRCAMSNAASQSTSFLFAAHGSQPVGSLPGDDDDIALFQQLVQNHKKHTDNNQ